MSVTLPVNNHTSRVLELARQIEDPKMCIRATADIVEHAEQSLSGRDSLEALKEGRAIIRLARHYISGQTGVTYAKRKMLERAEALDQAPDQDVWEYYLAAGYLAWMMPERANQPEKLTQAAQKARIAVISAADKGPGYGGTWAAEGDWQVRYLELFLGLRIDPLVSGRLRVSLLAT